jgi:uncharacterized protein (TIGR03790 family)
MEIMPKPTEAQPPTGPCVVVEKEIMREAWLARRNLRGYGCPWLFLLFLSSIGSHAWAALDSSQILILVNKDTDISSKVAHMYQNLRGIPNENILRLSLGGGQQITPEQYWKQAGTPIKQYLEAHQAIRCILTTSGVPYLILATDGKDEGAAFDNQLADVLREETGDRKRRQPNPLYINGTNRYALSDPRLLKMVYVVRLDGPDLKTMTRMVEDAIAAEKTGLQGLVAGDAQGIDGVTEYGEGDASIRAVVDRLSAAGFESTLDMKQETWRQPKDGIGTQAAGAAFYVGWYALLDFQDIFGQQGLARGSIAWHIASQEAQDIWKPNGRGWCINLMRRGAAVTLGPVREPYVAAFPHGDVFADLLLMGSSIAESYWLALPHVSWAMVILGDPLYRPFAFKPKPALIATAYVSSGSTGVLQKGESASLLVQLDCIGPAGSSLPALSAMVEPEVGLAAASGSVVIPALKAGESTVVRIPRVVTAANDPTGMFRLRLNVQTEGERLRRIVLEGRIGFSRLTGGIGPKTQMYASPNGKVLVSGLPGGTTLIETETLRSQAVRPPQGYSLISAEFSPDSRHMAVLLVDLQQKKGSVLITDNKLGNLQQLPAGTQFLRWLDKDKVLLKAENHLIEHNIAGGEDRNVDIQGIRSGNLIAGTEIQFVITLDGKKGIKKPGEPFREVLEGANTTEASAVANDLSLFGGVDPQKRLWVQHGLNQRPEILVTDVHGILWGPISRRVLVREANNKTRAYDARDRSWMELGEVLQAQWSPDEERLLFIGRAGEGAGYLALFSNRKIEPLCDMRKIGAVSSMTVSTDGERAFLLAGLSGQLNVWMMALPAPSRP